MTQQLEKISLLRKRWFPALAGTLLVIVLVKLLWQDLSPVSTPTSPPSTAKPDYFLASATSHIFNTAGKKTRQLNSHYLEYIRNTGVTKLTSPTFKIYQTDHNQWQGQADAGFMYEVAPQSSIVTNKIDELLWLQGAVQFHNHNDENDTLNTPNKLYKFTTESLKVWPQQNKVTGQELITLANGDNLLSAENILFDLNEHHFIFKNNFVGKILPGNQ